jgi:hypothetical protein
VRKQIPPDAAPQDIIPPYAFEFYRVAVDDAVRSAVSSFLAYGEVIQNDGSEAEAARLLHDALTHSAAVSRFFWPPKIAGALAAFRGEQLRKIYDVDETSALFNRDLRNELEHFDEKLDNWLREIPVGPIIASPVFADHSIVDEGFGHAFKVVDFNNDVFVILGRKYEFGSICREVVRLLSDDDCSGEKSEA